MTFELFCDYIVFPNGRVIDPDGYNAHTVSLAEHMVRINNEWYSKANLLARLFLPYQDGMNHLAFKDGNVKNYSLDNLFLTDEPFNNKVTLDKPTRLEYFDKINEAIKKGNEEAPEIALMIDALNGGNRQGERAPIEYPELDLFQKKSGQFAPIVEVIDAETGCHVMSGSAKDICNRLGVNVYETYKSYSQQKTTKDGYQMIPLALVPKQFINAQVTVKNNKGLEVSTGSYSEICQIMNLNYESLSDILNYGSDEPVNYFGYTFEINQKEGKTNE